MSEDYRDGKVPSRPTQMRSKKMTANFTATIAPVASCNPGSTITMTATIAAATAADAGTYYVALMVYNSASPATEVSEQVIYNQTLTVTPQTFSLGYQLPATLAPGVYTVRASVQTTTWQWQNVTQTPASFNVVAVTSVLYGKSSPFP